MVSKFVWKSFSVRFDLLVIQYLYEGWALRGTVLSNIDVQKVMVPSPIRINDFFTYLWLKEKNVNRGISKIYPGRAEMG